MKVAKKAVQQTHKYVFSSNIPNLKVYFCQVHWIVCSLTQPGMFSLAFRADPLRS